MMQDPSAGFPIGRSADRSPARHHVKATRRNIPPEIRILEPYSLFAKMVFFRGVERM